METPTRYINLLTDFGFKLIFGEEANKDLLIDFLNVLLNPVDKIVDVKFDPTEDRHFKPDDRALIYDVHCTTADGRHFVVEMQNRFQAHFRERALYYLSSDIAKQGLKGDKWDYRLDGAIGIFFMNFDWREDKGQQILDEIGLTNLRTHEVFTDKMRMFFLKLPLVKENPEDCKTELDQWLYIIKNLENMESITFTRANGNQIFEKLSNVAEFANLPAAAQRKYEQSLKAYRDSFAVEKTAHDEGFAEGMEKGMEKGRSLERLGIIQTMRSKCMSDSEIAELTGLSLNEIIDITRVN